MQAKQLKNMNDQTCQICSDTVGVSAMGDIFVACNECAFPVCRPYYECECKEGNQCCPQCKTRYKRHKGLFFFVKHTVFTDVLHLCHNCDGLMKFTSSYDEFTRLNFLKIMNGVCPCPVFEFRQSSSSRR
jgi:hypothetical protein